MQINAYRLINIRIFKRKLQYKMDLILMLLSWKKLHSCTLFIDLCVIVL